MPHRDHLPFVASSLAPSFYLFPLSHRASSLNGSSINDDNESTTESTSKDEEFSHAELFYDLFFVANLTVFTYIHPVNDLESLTQYIGFFCILWFTWYQVGLFDVRFSADSLVERICRACQLIVMIGFATIGPDYKVGTHERQEKHQRYQMLTLMLMTSRFVLAFQYLLAMYLRMKSLSEPEKKGFRWRMGVLVAVYVSAGIIYCSLYPTFSKDGRNDGYKAWYAIGLLESCIVTGMALSSPHLDFRGSHLIERMSLLTLIILGEGVIGIAKQCQIIAKSETFSFRTASNAGVVVCGVLILYLVYMIYFDWIIEKRSKLRRQLVWSALHFPFHMALVLAVEGINQCVIWRAASVGNETFLKETVPEYDEIDPDWEAVAEGLRQRSQAIFLDLFNTSMTPEVSLASYEKYGQVEACTSVIANGAQDASLARAAWMTLVNHSMNAIYQIAGYVPPEELPRTLDCISIEGRTNANIEAQSIEAVFRLTYIFLFVAIGLTIMFSTGLALLSCRIRDLKIFHIIRLGFSAIVGFILCMLSLAAVDESQLYYDFMSSSWLLPVIASLLFLVVVLNEVKMYDLNLSGHVRGRPDAALNESMSYNVSAATSRAGSRERVSSMSISVA